MSQTKVTSFYVTRRSARNQNSKVSAIQSTKNIAVTKDVIAENKGKKSTCSSSSNQTIKAATIESAKNLAVIKNVLAENKRNKSKCSSSINQSSNVAVIESTKKIAVIKDVLADSKGKKSECSSSTGACCFSFNSQRSVSKNICEEKKISEKSAENKVRDQDILRSPKRNLSNPNEGTPPKKKSLILSSEVASENMQSPSKFLTPKKLFNDDQTREKSNEKTIDKKSTEQTPEKKEVIIPNRSEETKKAIANFKAKLALVKNYEANSFKATSIVSPTQRLEKKSAIPTVPAHQKYSYLVDPEISSSLILPFKYKLLSEMFRSMDTVISILNNRKEKITFDKVKGGVQQMMKRTFSQVNLRQIMTVMPTAYDVTLEKCTFKKANDPDYQLIITPKLSATEGNNKKSKSHQTIIMSPQDLFEREQCFHSMLLNLVKQHHQVFISRLNFPSVPAEKIKRWHPKFAVDSVPDIEAATLPEIPENKIHTAKDVLNKIVKSSFRGKVVKALKSVAEETANADKKIELEPSPSDKKPPLTKSALKGVCTDLIAKIRARESAKLLETMIETPDEAKRKAMLERLPKIIQVLWHYFIAERKAAVPVDTAVEKIIHSCSSLSTHEEVKAHLHLITEKCPGWLSFIQIPKGLYITINKNKNITEMLEKFQH